MVVHHLGLNQQQLLRSIDVHGAHINTASTPRTSGQRWFHVKPRSYSSDAPFSL